MEKKDVFVTYSWDNEEHKNRVLAFVNDLRREGFNAEMDRLRSQNETATDFPKMMHQAMTDYEKVIVVLSRGYKVKAESFKGGAGNEYNLIIKDIETQSNKYILVSFEPISDEIAPLSFRGRQTINVSDQNNLNELFAKLQNEKIIDFSEVGKQKPVIKKTTIPKFEFQVNNLEISSLESKINGANMFANKYDDIEYQLNIKLENTTTETFSDYSLEMSCPKSATEHNVEGRIEGNYKIIQFDDNPKIFLGQTKEFKLNNFVVRQNNAEEILKDKVTICVSTNKGKVIKEFELNEVLFIDNYRNEKLTVGMFQDRHYG